MALLDRVVAGLPARVEQRFSVDTWLQQYLIPGQFNYNGASYPLHGLTQTLAGDRVQRIAATLPGYAAALRRCPPAFAAQMVRALVLSGVRFTWRNLPSSATPRRTFGTRELGLLERPWPHATTGDLVSLMEWHSGLAGNSFVVRRPGRLHVLRPDWCGLVFGSQQEPDLDAAPWALDAELVGLIYQPGGIGSALGKPQTLLPSEFAHWFLIPDPETPWVGQSWVTAALTDIQGDQAATEHKIRFFENGATPNMVVKGLQAADQEKFNDLVDMIEEKHAGVRNAYKTLYLSQGADATVVGANLQQLDFKVTQGAGETRIAMLGRVPAPLLGISEGLGGSSLNAGNFGMARRIFADSWVYPALQNLAASLESLLTVPPNPRTGVQDAELWFDTADMPILREDAKDAADIAQVNAVSITTYVKEGFTPESAVAAVIGRDESLLKHTGRVSVQLQQPGAAQLPPAGAPALPSGRSVGEVAHPAATAHLMEYWAHGEGAAKIAWGAPGDFDRCRVQLGKYVQRPDELAGLCANLHHKALGVWPGQEHGGKGHH